MKKITLICCLFVAFGLFPIDAFAARLFSTGFEWGSATAGVEWGTNTGTPAVSTIQKNGGTYSLLLNNTTGESIAHTISSIDTYYLRYYVYVDSLNSITTDTFSVTVRNGANYIGYVTFEESGGNLDLIVRDNTGGSTITDTATVAFDTWYMVEIYANAADAAGQDDITVLVDGVQVAAATNLTLTTAATSLNAGISTIVGSPTVYVDDIALNSTSGAEQNSWPGAGKIVAAVPNAAGFSACSVGTFSSINEIPASDTSTGSTDRCELQTNGGMTATFNVTDSGALGIESFDTISLLYLMVRAKEASSNTTVWQPLISANGSATTTGSATDAGDTTNRTNPSGTTAFGNTIISYTNPATSLAWTPTGTNSIDSLKVGATGTDFNPDLHIQTMAVMVEYRDVNIYLSPTALLSGKWVVSNGKMLIY